MRHGKKNAKLGRTSSHRRLMLSNMSCSLIKHKRITTTLVKAKALQKYIEPLITKSKNNTMHSRRMVFRYLRNKYGVSELFDNISMKVSNRDGGYTRIIKLENRLGDNAKMCIIEFVDYNDLYIKDHKKSGKKRTRRSKKPTDNLVQQSNTIEQHPVKEESPVKEEAKVEDSENLHDKKGNKKSSNEDKKEE